MKVKILVSMAGNDFAWKPGDVVVVEDQAEAARMVSAGFAIPVQPEPETAVVSPQEKRGKSK